MGAWTWLNCIALCPDTLKQLPILPVKTFQNFTPPPDKQPQNLLYMQVAVNPRTRFLQLQIFGFRPRLYYHNLLALFASLHLCPTTSNCPTIASWHFRATQHFSDTRGIFAYMAGHNKLAMRHEWRVRGLGVGARYSWDERSTTSGPGNG
jgi:hypothetical protein